jgi:NADH-quinone oxidoreductase subunit M
MSSSSFILNGVIYLPLAAAVLLAFLPRGQHSWFKVGALAASVATLVLSLSLVPEFDVSKNAEFQLVTAVPWIPQFGVQYKIGVDGISLVLLLLTALLSAIAILSSWDAIHERVKEYYICLLLLETGMLGVFVALDLIVFYVFWEAMLIPMYFLIGVWGGPRKLYATIKFVLYTLTGSLLMLVAIIWLYVASSTGGMGSGTFDIEQLTGPGSPVAQNPALGPNVRLWLFLAFALAFAIKVPMFPFHTWLPDAHVEAPTAGSVILAGVLLKMGTYGFVRFCIPLFPDVSLRVAPWFLALAVIGIIYGALMAYVQQDVKRLVAYSSVSHLGFCILGLFAFTPEGVSGSVLQMINHGLSTGGLFLLVGMIYERRHTRDIAAFGGLWKVIPIFALFFLITTLSSVGLPGLNGFVGEFLILLGTWGPPGKPNNQAAAALGATGVILGAVYMLWMFQRMMKGPLTRAENRRLPDLNLREIVTLLPLVALMFWIGLFPNSTLRMFDQAVYARVVQPIEDARSQSRPTPPGTVLPPGLMPGMPGMPGAPPGMPGHPAPPAPGTRTPVPGTRTPRAAPRRPGQPSRPSQPSRPAQPRRQPAAPGTRR